MQTIQKHTIYGVSLGAGDPDLITVKGLRILNESDVIFFPRTQKEGRQKSFAHRLLAHHQLKKPRLQGVFFEMSNDRTKVLEVYQKTATTIIALQNQGQKIAIVCEGDLSFYASFAYFLSIFKKEKVPFEMIAGVPAPHLASAVHQIPLGLWHEKIAIIPKITHPAMIDEYFNDFETIVLLKIKPVWRSLRKFLLKKSWNIYYSEHLGTPQQWTTTAVVALPKEVPYFSLLILKK